MHSSRFSRRVRGLFAHTQRRLNRAAGAPRGVSVDVGACIEAFEPRTLLAAVFWDGGAGTNSWHDAANWNRGGVDAVPLNGDDVTIDAAANPTVTYSSGVLTLASLVSNEALTITSGTLGLTPVTGTADINNTLVLSGGNLAGGTWDFTGGTLRATASGGTITDALINGDLIADSTSATVRVAGTTRFGAARLTANNAGIHFAPGYTLSDLVVVEGATGGQRNITGAVGGVGSLTIAPSGVIRVAAGAGAGLTINNSNAFTLINNGLISSEAASRTITFNNSILTNNAIIQALAGTIDITPTTLTNAGSITAANATLTLGGAWSSSGTITVNASTLNLAGTFTSAGLSISRTASVINLTGTMNNTGNTFTFGVASGSWNLQGGGVTGGTLAFTAGERLVMTAGAGNLTDVQINGDLLLDAANSAVRILGTTRFTAARLSASNSGIQFAPGYTLNDLVVAEGAATGQRTITGAVGGNGTLTISNTGVIRLAAGAGGNLSINNSNTLTVINNGLISAEAAGRTLSFNNTALTNNGAVQVTAGTLDLSPSNWSNAGSITAANAVLTLGGAWANSGTITETNSTVNLAGTFSSTGLAIARTGGTINVTGTMNNTGNTLAFNAATGSWNLLGGTFSGGTIVFTGADRLLMTSSGGNLTDVQVNGELLMDSTNAAARMIGTTRFAAARLSANNAGIQFAPGYTLNDLVVAEGAATGQRTITGAVGGNGTLTISTTGVIRLAAGAGGNLTIQNSNSATIINNGLISAEATGRSLTFNNTALTNNGTAQVIAGTLDVSPSNWTNPGALIASANTVLTLAGAWSSTGTITATSATVNLGGTFSSTGLVITRTGGTINLTGAMTNTGNTVTFTATTGAWNLLGGTINGGTLVFTASDRLLMTSSGGTLADVQVNGELLLDTTNAAVRVAGTTRFAAARLSANNAGIQFAPGYTLNDLVVAEGAATGQRTITGAVGGNGTITISSTGVIRLAAGAGANLTIQNSNSATVINNGLISAEAAGRSLTFNNTTFTNNGATQVSAGTLDISPTNWSNAGSVTASNAVLNLAGTWSSTGTIVATNSTVNLGGVFLTTGFSLSRTGGVVNVTGQMNNTGNTFNFTPSTGAWNLSGGSISGGAINFIGSDRLLITPNAGTLFDVQVNGELLFDTTNAVARMAGTTRFTAARLSASNASIQFAPGYTLNDLVVAEGAAAGQRSITGAVGGNGALTIGATGVIRLAAGAGANLAIQNSNTVTVINNGLISAEAAGRVLAFNNTTFTNNGTTQVLAGTLDISPTNWTNAGTLIANNATLSLAGVWSSSGQIQSTGSTLNLGGVFNAAGVTLVRSGGIVNITGAMTNTGNTITFTAVTGSWNLSGGSITGGSLNMAGANRLVPTPAGGSLIDVQVTGDLLVDQTGAAIRIAGSTRFTAARLTAGNTGINFAPDYVLHDLVSAEGPAAGPRTISGAVGGNGTLTIAPTGVIRLAAGSGGNLAIQNSNTVTLINNGVIAAEAAGRTLSITVTTVQNVAKGVLTGGTWIASGSSPLTLPAGVIITTNNANVTVGGAASFPALATLRTNNGSLSTAGGGTFTITPAGGTFTNNGVITLRPINTVAIAGNFTQVAAASFIVQVQGDLPADIGRLTVTGTATLDGTLTVTAVNGWDPECINSVFINAGTVSGQFATQSLPTPPDDHQTFIVYLGEVRFAISPPSDYNRDGFLNSQDIFDFLIAFFDLSPEADFNNDGFVNSQDFFDFIADFFEGCP